MAQAIDDLRNFRRWRKIGSVGYDGPMHFLERQGYVLANGWGWRKPSASHAVTPEEADAIHFLVEEWDFRGLES
jgi:hypothetical protein